MEETGQCGGVEPGPGLEGTRHARPARPEKIEVALGHAGSDGQIVKDTLQCRSSMKTSHVADSNRNCGAPAGAASPHRLQRAFLMLPLLGVLLPVSFGGLVVAQENPSALSAALTPEAVELTWNVPGIVESAAEDISGSDNGLANGSKIGN